MCNVLQCEWVPVHGAVFVLLHAAARKRQCTTLSLLRGKNYFSVKKASPGRGRMPSERARRLRAKGAERFQTQARRTPSDAAQRPPATTATGCEEAGKRTGGERKGGQRGAHPRWVGGTWGPKALATADADAAWAQGCARARAQERERSARGMHPSRRGKRVFEDTRGGGNAGGAAGGLSGSRGEEADRRRQAAAACGVALAVALLLLALLPADILLVGTLAAVVRRAWSEECGAVTACCMPAGAPWGGRQRRRWRACTVTPIREAREANLWHRPGLTVSCRR